MTLYTRLSRIESKISRGNPLQDFLNGLSDEELDAAIALTRGAIADCAPEVEDEEFAGRFEEAIAAAAKHGWL